MDQYWIAQNLDQDFAIRQFCPARLEQEPPQQHHPEQLYPNCNVFDEMPQLTSSQVDEIFDAFFDVECYERDNANKSEEEDDEEFVASYEFDDQFREPSPTADPDLHHPMMNGADGVDQGLQLVHSLLACAEAVSCRDSHLADKLLAQIWPFVGPSGHSLQRVCYWFAQGLKSRLTLLRRVHPNGYFANGSPRISSIDTKERVEALGMLHRATPYVAFGFLAANDAICRRYAGGKEPLHIVDLGMDHTLQWGSLLQKLASTSGENSRSTIRITGMIGDRDPSLLESSVNELYKEAAALNISLEFNMVSESISASSLTPKRLNLRKGESLLINSIMYLHKHVKESRGSLKTVLQGIKNLSPSLLIVVEQDANHNGPFFLGRFLESLHYYSAVFDSLDASLPRSSPERAKIEREYFGEEICNVVAYEGLDRVERHERADQWRRQLGRAGFQAAGMMSSLEEARGMVGEYGCEGFTVGSEKGCLLLGWKGRPVMLASAWLVNNNVSASSS